MKHRMNRMTTIWMTMIVALAFSIVSYAAPPNPKQQITQVDLDTDGRWEVEYDGKIYDPVNNTTTFSYTVTINDDPALSHLTLGFALCDSPFNVVSYNPINDVTMGLDPTTGVSGIKWDIGLDPGLSRSYSYTLQGNISEGLVDVAVKAGLFAAIGERGGPSCETTPPVNTYSISGVLFVDADGDGVWDAGEPILEDVTVDLYDEAGNLVASTMTNGSGDYSFTDLLEGNYVVRVPMTTHDADDFNEVLSAYFSATTPVGLVIPLADANSVGNDFGFEPSTGDIIADLNSADPDGDGFVLQGTGKTIGYWKHQLTVAIKGKGQAQVNSGTLAGYVTAIEKLYLAHPFQFAYDFPDAHAILSSTSSVAVDLLKKQLLGTEFNEIAGLGLTGDYDAMQSVLVWWGEYLVANQSSFSRDELLAAKNIFDAINNTGE